MKGRKRLPGRFFLAPGGEAGGIDRGSLTDRRNRSESPLIPVPGCEEDEQGKAKLK